MESKGTALGYTFDVNMPMAMHSYHVPLSPSVPPSPRTQQNKIKRENKSVLSFADYRVVGVWVASSSFKIQKKGREKERKTGLCPRR